MTATPPRNVIVEVHIAGVLVSLGQATVGAMWCDIAMVSPRRWYVRAVPRSGWRVIAPPKEA